MSIEAAGVTPPVTVIMPVRNGEQFLDQALASLFAQTYPNFSLVVVDDGSVDRTPEILERCGDPRLLVIRNDRPAGPAAARNTGLDAAATRYVAFLDADDIADPRRLELQLAFLARNREVGLLAGRVAVIDDSGRRTGNLWGHQGAAAMIAPAMLFRNCLATSTVIVDREVVGAERFDPTLPVASDYDMWLRLADRTRVACLPDVAASYRVHPGNLTHTRQASADACLDRIVRRCLVRLGIEPSAAEVQLHRRLGGERCEGTDEFMTAVAAWLRKLDAANQAASVYRRRPFRRVLRAYWLGACQTAALQKGWQAWPLMVRSPLLRQAAFDPSAWGRIAYLPWRSAKTSLRHLRRDRVVASSGSN